MTRPFYWEKTDHGLSSHVQADAVPGQAQLRRDPVPADPWPSGPDGDLLDRLGFRAEDPA